MHATSAPGFFCAPPRILTGAGCRHGLAPLLERMGHKRAVLVTDTFFSRKSAFAQEIVNALAAQNIACTMFDGGEADPTLALCDTATVALAGAQPDCVIALGGGSNIDLAKVLCLTLVSGSAAESFVGVKRFPVKPLPLVALPTTAGTASEITPGAILIKRADLPKVAVMSNDLRAAVAVIDAELTLTCPPRVTADAGMDALAHAIESFITQDAALFDREGDPDPGYSGRTPLTMMFAREAMRLVFRHLRTAFVDGSNIAARTGMCDASFYAGLSYASAGLNAVHALAYGLGAVKHDTHGRSNAVLLPYVIDSLHAARAPELEEVRAIAAEEGWPAVSAAHAVRDLMRALEMPETLRAFGISADQLSTVVAGGLAVARLTKAYPAPDAPRAYQTLVQAAFDGTLSA